MTLKKKLTWYFCDVQPEKGREIEILYRTDGQYADHWTQTVQEIGDEPFEFGEDAVCWRYTKVPLAADATLQTALEALDIRLTKMEGFLARLGKF